MIKGFSLNCMVTRYHHKIFIIFLIVLVFLLISSYFISFFHGTVGYLRLSLRASFKRKENKEIQKNITHLQLKTTAWLIVYWNYWKFLLRFHLICWSKGLSSKNDLLFIGPQLEFYFLFVFFFWEDIQKRLSCKIVYQTKGFYTKIFSN